MKNVKQFQHKVRAFPSNKFHCLELVLGSISSVRISHLFIDETTFENKQSLNNLVYTLLTATLFKH